MKKQQLYVIEYYINNTLKETINLNTPTAYIIAKTKADRLKRTTHKIGKLIPVKSK